MIKSWEEYITMVEKMRVAQNDYNRTRDPLLLKELRHLELDVDAAIKVHKERRCKKATPLELY